MPRRLALLVVLAVGGPAVASEPPAVAPPVHVVFRNATVYDGTGGLPITGDLHLRDGKIVAVGAVGKVAGADEIDAAGLVVCPGFIDLHTHSDGGPTPLTSPTGRRNKNYLTQGVTTVVTGNCGSGPVDVAKYFAALEVGRVGSNVIHLAPHNSIRGQVMGNQNRPPTADELAKMTALVDKAMADGAWGLATGLIYTPGTYAKTDEVVALAKAAARRGGLYASHIRNEEAGLLDALDEAIAVGRQAGCRVHISHIKANEPKNWGKSAAAVGLIEAARRTGQEVTADQYPYVASSTSLRANVVPAKHREGTEKDFVARLADPQVQKDIAAMLGGRDGAGRYQIARYAPKPAWQGKRMAQIADAEGKDPLEVVLEIERNGGAQIVHFGMSEEDMRVYMKQPWVATASDGGVMAPGDTVPHPRSYGTFPRKIGRLAVEEKLVSVEHAIRSATGLPADILKLADRGYLKPGCRADVVVFDPKTFRDTATFEKPHQYAAGVRWVFVNGRAAVADGAFREDVLAGEVLRHPGK